VGSALVRLDLARVKFLGRGAALLGAEIWSSEKSALGGYDFTSTSLRFLDQSSPDLFCLTREESSYSLCCLKLRHHGNKGRWW